MKKLYTLPYSLLLSIALTGCASTGSDSEMVTTVPIMETVLAASDGWLKTTTASDDAGEQFQSGRHAMEMGRGIDAHEHFEAAVEADPGFAIAYLYLANTSPSLQGFTKYLGMAEESASSSSHGEQLLIKITRLGFDNDIEGQLAAAQELVAKASKSPRAWLALAGIQSGLNQHTEARNSIWSAIALAPEMASCYMQLGNSYLVGEPRDLDQAEKNMQKAADLEPNEAVPYDLLGDVFRMQGQLEKARDAYTESSKYSGEDGLAYQQRGHVHSFLGDFEAARADYDKSISMARANQAIVFGVFRCFVHVHAGDPAAAITELQGLVAKNDMMDPPGPPGNKIFALASAISIATHHNMSDVAETLISDWAALMRAQAEQAGTDEVHRAQEAAIAYTEGWLAVGKGEFDKAEMKAGEITQLVEPDANPRKMEPVHELQGKIALAQGNYAAAVDHLMQGDYQNDVYIRYHLAKALEGAEQTDQAMKHYKHITHWNFNSIGLALTRKEAEGKVGM